MRVAVFVDAGYVYAQGSLLVSGSEAKKPRIKINIEAKEIVSLLTKFARAVSGEKELLRIYWYDGAPATGQSAEQAKFAQVDNVKLRLGQLNSAGQQKGVDSLIVTDLTELARNRAITDAVLLAGDEDIRIAVQIAQNHGVRVHLLGIDGVSQRGSQSISLQDEADTVRVWSKSEVKSFMTVIDDQVKDASKPGAEKKVANPKAEAETPDIQKITDIAVNEALTKLRADPAKLPRVSKIVEDGKPTPGDVVKPLYAGLKTQLKREPVKSEKDKARELLKIALLRK
jgi:uncharacterized LabA/DUF88 family protein